MSRHLCVRQHRRVQIVLYRSTPFREPVLPVECQASNSNHFHVRYQLSRHLMGTRSISRSSYHTTGLNSGNLGAGNYFQKNNTVEVKAKLESIIAW